MTSSANTPAETAPTFVVPPCNDELRVVWRDNDLFVISKPSGLLSVPGRDPRNQDSASHRLMQKDPNIRVVHRLDMDTSGLMVFARNRDAQTQLNRQFSERSVYKEYIALVDGNVANSAGEVSLPLICDWPNRPRQMVCHVHGKPALTRWQRVPSPSTAIMTRMRLIPITGRSHQLRVHMAAIGHPILGCRFYGNESTQNRTERLCLHAHRLAFTHPITGNALEFEDASPF